MCVCRQKHIETALVQMASDREPSHTRLSITIIFEPQCTTKDGDGRVKEDVQVMLATCMLTLVHVVLDFELQLPGVRLHPVHVVLQVLLVLFMSVLELNELLHGHEKKRRAKMPISIFTA